MPDKIQPAPAVKDEGSGEHVIEYGAISSSWRGPLPPPHHLGEYERVFPGCAERIVAMAEAESEHRRSEERAETEHRRLVIVGELKAQQRGMVLAFVLAVLGLALGAFLLYSGHLAWGVGLVGVELVSLVSLFLVERRQGSPEPPDNISEELQPKLPFPRN